MANNGKIVRKIGFVGDYNGDPYNVNTELREMIKEEAEKKETEEKEQKEKERNASFKDKQTEGYAKERKIQKVEEKGTIQYTEKAFTDKLLEMYMNSLVMDTDFIQEHYDTIRNFFLVKLEESIQDGDVSKFMEYCNEKTEYLTNLVESCKKKGKKKVKKLLKRIKEEDTPTDDIDDVFNEVLTDEDDAEGIGEGYLFECDDKNSNKDVDMDAEEVSNIVKDKVVKVIQKEEENNAKKKELLDDLNTSNEIGESVSIFKNGMTHHTLFNSIFISNYKSCINSVQNKSNNQNYVDISESGEIQVNMDYVLCDTILEYTRLELYNTLKMIDPSPKELREMADEYAYFTNNKK